MKNESRGKTGRPPGFSREQAITEAMNLFWARGVLNVTAKELANAMSIQRSSFYNSFGSRNAVFAEAFQMYSERSPGIDLLEVKEGDPVIPAVVAMFRKVCMLRAQDPDARGCLVSNAVAELAGTKTDLDAILQKEISKNLELFERLVGQAIKQDELSADTDAVAVARALVAFLFGLNLLSKIIHDESALWATTSAFLSNLREFRLPYQTTATETPVNDAEAPPAESVSEPAFA